MEKVRVRDIAKELGMKSSKEILLLLERMGQKGKSASSNIEGDLIEKVRSHFRKGAPPPPPRERLLEVTHADGTIERKSSRVVLRRSAPEPEIPAEPPPPLPEEVPAAEEVPLPSAAVPEEIPESPAEPQAPLAAEEAPAEPSIRVVEAPPPSKAEEERKEKEKKWKRVKPSEKKVQKGVLKKHIIQEIVEEPEGPLPVDEKPAPEAAVVRQFQPVRVQKRRGRPAREKKAPSSLPPKASKRVFKIEEVITVGDLAHRMGIKAGEVIKRLIEMGMPTTVNQLLDADAAGLMPRSTGSRWRTSPPRWRPSSTRRWTGRKILLPGRPSSRSWDTSITERRFCWTRSGRAT